MINSIIQKEFVKIALNWEDLPVEQQKLYLSKHPKSKKHLVVRPKMDNIAEQSINILSDVIKDSPFKGKAFICGGYVRDKILGKPSKDIDITVAAPNGGIELANFISKKLNIREPVIFPTFGTAKIQLPTGLDIEFVQTRNEEYVKGSRKPTTSYGTLQEDVERRDFTINTLLEDVTTKKIVDLTGQGIDDLKNGIIRTPLDPNITFDEDPLRMLRAIRFAAKYNFEFAEDIIPALSNNADKLKNISKERIHDELNKMLLTDKPSRAFNIMRKTGLLDQFMPELTELYGLKQGKYHYTDAWGHTMDVLDSSVNSLVGRLSALMHDIGKSKTLSFDDKNEPHFYQHEKVSADIASDILKRLKYSNDIIEKVSKIIESHMRVRDSKNWSKGTTRKFIKDMGLELTDTLDLIEADRKSHHPKHNDLDALNQLRFRINDIQNEKPVETIIPPLSGKEIMDILNLPTGPLVGKVKNYLQDLILENPNLTKEQAIESLKKFKLS